MIRLAALALALAVPATADAQGSLSQNPPTETVICLDVNGSTLPAVCKTQGSRLDLREDICLCYQGQRVQAPICGPGQKPQGENRAFEKARKAAARDGSLVGDLYQGKPMCVAQRRP